MELPWEKRGGQAKEMACCNTDLSRSQGREELGKHQWPLTWLMCMGSCLLSRSLVPSYFDSPLCARDTELQTVSSFFSAKFLNTEVLQDSI